MNPRLALVALVALGLTVGCLGGARSTGGSTSTDGGHDGSQNAGGSTGTGGNNGTAGIGGNGTGGNGTGGNGTGTAGTGGNGTGGNGTGTGGNNGTAGTGGNGTGGNGTGGNGTGTGGNGTGGNNGTAGTGGTGTGGGGNMTGAGSVMCGQSPCDVSHGGTCCASQQGYACVKSGTFCPVNPATPIKCDGPEDCPNQICCGTLIQYNGQTIFTQVVCQSSCSLQNQRVLCGNHPSVCQSGSQCVDSTSLPGFRVCS